MKIFELSFIDPDVKVVFEAFEYAESLVNKNISIGIVIYRTFENYSPTYFNSVVLNKVRQCAEYLCDDESDKSKVFQFCDYAEIASGGYNFGYDCGINSK